MQMHTSRGNYRPRLLAVEWVSLVMVASLKSAWHWSRLEKTMRWESRVSLLASAPLIHSHTDTGTAAT